jgi:hypothetical protein
VDKGSGNCLADSEGINESISINTFRGILKRKEEKKYFKK